MKTFRIYNTMGGELGTYKAESEDHALDLMAMDCGYESYAAIPSEIGGGDTLKVEEEENEE